MRLSQRQLRRLIEAEVDKMRLPRGPNSRDDGDKDLTEEDLAEGRLNEEIDPVYDTIGGWAEKLGDALTALDTSLGETAGEATSDTYEAMDAISQVVYKMLSYARMKPKN